MRIILIRYFICAFFIFLTNVTQAQDTGFRGIIGYGCHRSDGTCYVLLDGPTFTGGLIAQALNYDGMPKLMSMGPHGWL